MKRIWTWLSTILLATLLLSGCASNKPDTSSSNQLPQTVTQAPPKPDSPELLPTISVPAKGEGIHGNQEELTFAKRVEVWNKTSSLCLEATVNRVEKEIASYGHKDNAAFLRTQVQPPLKRIASEVREYQPTPQEKVIAAMLQDEISSLERAVELLIEAFDTKDDETYNNARSSLHFAQNKNKQFAEAWKRFNKPTS